MKKRILLSTGIHNREWILPYYLNSLYNINYDKKFIDIYWIANNNFDRSEEILYKFKNLHEKEYNSITIEIMNNSQFDKDERITGIREQYTYQWLSFIRNKIFRKVEELDCDYLFSVDSDVLVKSSILNDLLSTGKDICASLLYNGYLKNILPNAYAYPNILKYENGNYKHIVNYHVKHYDKTSKDKLIECDATGACCIYSKEVCNNTYFQYHRQGEDIGFAEVCRERGYKMYCLPSCYSQHVMSKDFLEQFKDFK